MTCFRFASSLLIVSIAMFVVNAYKRTSANHLKQKNYKYTFEEYVAEYGKVYNDETEYAMRRSVFEHNLERVRLHNEAASVAHRTWVMGINRFTDRTLSELSQMRGYNRALAQMSRRSNANVPSVINAEVLAALPESVDWRAVPGVLTAVKDQGYCGSCWAFASAATMESYWFLLDGETMDLSVQSIVSCTPNPHHCGGLGGCNGATAELAYQYVIDNKGLGTEWISPYMQYHNNITLACPKNPPAVMSLTGFQKLPENDLASVMVALQKGPLTVSVDASLWNSYESGIFDGCNPSNITLDHAVQLVGYGIDNSGSSPLPYWIVRNSWGVDFGENGYIRVARTLGAPTCGTDYKPTDGSGCEGGPSTVRVCGSCGILYDTSYPIVSPSGSDSVNVA